MLEFYFFSVILTSLAILFPRYCLSFLVVVCVYFLLTLESTGYDYDHYQEAFDNAYFISYFPWFKTDSSITAEPFYLWYNSLIGVLFPFGFKFFLSLNFFICFTLSYIFFSKTPRNNIVLFWLAFLPVVFPTLFYFSPRSSISFFLVMGGMIYLSRSKFKISISLFFLGLTIHSQYIPISFFLIGTYIIHYLSQRLTKIARISLLILYSLMALFLLANVESILDYISAILGILPSGDFATAKLHYISSTSTGLRLTAILSIIVYPISLIFLIKRSKISNIFFYDKETDSIFLMLLAVSVFFGAAINLIFIESPHVAGRVARYSDYISMGLLLPVVIKIYAGWKFAVGTLVALSLIAPVIYPTVYNF